MDNQEWSESDLTLTFSVTDTRVNNTVNLTHAFIESNGWKRDRAQMEAAMQIEQMYSDDVEDTEVEWDVLSTD